ncbi:ROK family protein [Pseudomonas sp. R2.Fl]|nr:ROK family protein [Pseudomonas sp. R2.Fl]
MIVCFDIGGTAIKGAYATAADAIETLGRLPTPLDDFDAFVATLQGVIDRAGEEPECVAISIAGVIEAETGNAIVANIPCIHRRPLKADLEARLGLPILIANDADSFAMAEAGIGAGRGHQVVFGIILGTGVGGGLVVDGRLINADGGFAGEWGHGPIAATEAGNPPVRVPRLRCGCGQSGCLDTICSARGIERLHTHITGEQASSETILADWLDGAEAARRTVDVYVDLLASPLALITNVTGATIMPVGGGLSNVPLLLTEIDKAVRARILRRFDRPLVVPAECRLEPGLIGAAMLGLSRRDEVSPELRKADWRGAR